VGGCAARISAAQFGAIRRNSPTDGPPTASADDKTEGRMPTEKEASSLLNAFRMIHQDIAQKLLIDNVFLK
jgi:hypothetical protein